MPALSGLAAPRSSSVARPGSLRFHLATANFYSGCQLEILDLPHLRAATHVPPAQRCLRCTQRYGWPDTKVGRPLTDRPTPQADEPNASALSGTPTITPTAPPPPDHSANAAE
jgi:hypothetical protein